MQLWLQNELGLNPNFAEATESFKLSFLIWNLWVMYKIIVILEMTCVKYIAHTSKVYGSDADWLFTWVEEPIRLH